MPKFKTSLKPIHPVAARLLHGAALALFPQHTVEPAGRPVWVGVLGGALGDAPEPHERLDVAWRRVSAIPGSRLISGWCVDSIRRRGMDKFVVVLEHHAVIELPGGQRLCPSTLVGQEIRFIEDAARPHAPDHTVFWNKLLFANVLIKGVLGSVPPYTLAWATNWGDDQAYSTDPRHGQWTAWGLGDPTARLVSLGLDANKLHDVVMTSDFDELAMAIPIRPHPCALNGAAIGALLVEVRKLHTQGIFEIHRSSPRAASTSDTAVDGTQATSLNLADVAST